MTRQIDTSLLEQMVFILQEDIQETESWMNTHEAAPARIRYAVFDRLKAMKKLKEQLEVIAK